MGRMTGEMEGCGRGSRDRCKQRSLSLEKETPDGTQKPARGLSRSQLGKENLGLSSHFVNSSPFYIALNSVHICGKAN